MSAHTPGPWRVQTSVNGLYVVRGLGALGDTALCKVLKVSGSARILERESERDANANLMAAAPDLLDAARAVVKCWGVGGQLKIDAFNGFIDELRDAIAKAEGVPCR